MQKKANRKYMLAGIVVALMLLSFITGALAVEYFLTVDSNVPSTTVNVNIGEGKKAPKATPNVTKKRKKAARSGNFYFDNEDADPVAPSLPAEDIPSRDPSAEITDDQGKWTSQTTINLFKAFYENESGKVTVKSAYGDKNIAPGTSNKYDFLINNTGNTGIRYQLESASELSFTVNGETKYIPLKVKLYTDEKYLLGGAESYAEMTKLDGLKDTGGLSPAHYVRYTIEWLWPFEGTDELDTLIGNMAAEGDDITVSIRFNITASEDDDAGGGEPITGENSNIGLYMLVAVSAMAALIILLFRYRRKEADE